ncbi:MAG: glycosyltransferase [Pirellulales bacterium]
MRLLFLSNEFPHAWEPTKAVFNLDLIKQLATQHDVSVVAPISWVDELRARFAGRGRLKRLAPPAGDLAVHHPRFWYTPGFWRHHYERFLWWSLRKSVSSIRVDQRPDCILSYWAHPDGACAVKLARRWKIPCLLMVGGSDVLLMTKDARRRRRVQEALVGADAVVTMSRDLAGKVIGMDVDPKHVHVMRRGVDGSIFFPGDKAAARRAVGISPDETALLWVGRMAPVKGVPTLLEAFQQLRARGVDAKLYLIGDGALRAALESDIARRGLADQVRMVGSVAHRELGNWFRAADATVLPSLSEGVPNVLLESLACGTPWVASKVGGIPEIATGDAARLAPPNDPHELACVLHKLLIDRPTVAETDRPSSLAQFADRIASLAASLRREHELAACPSRPLRPRGEPRPCNLNPLTASSSLASLTSPL